MKNVRVFIESMKNDYQTIGIDGERMAQFQINKTHLDVIVVFDDGTTFSGSFSFDYDGDEKNFKSYRFKIARLLNAELME